MISPRVGFSDRKKSRISDVLPAPDGPVRNWNDFGAMSKERSRRTSGPDAVAQADILEADHGAFGLALRVAGIESRKLRIKTLLTNLATGTRRPRASAGIATRASLDLGSASCDYWLLPAHTLTALAVDSVLTTMPAAGVLMVPNAIPEVQLGR